MPRTGARDTREIYQDGGKFTAIHTGTVTNDKPLILPFDCEIIGAMIHVDTILGTSGGVKQTFDLLVNTAEVVGGNVDLELDDLQPADTGALATPTARVYAFAGDKLELSSNDEQVAATVAWFTWLLRPA